MAYNINLMSTNFSKFASKSTENTNSTNLSLQVFLGDLSVQIEPFNYGDGQTGPLGYVDGIF